MYDWEPKRTLDPLSKIINLNSDQVGAANELIEVDKFLVGGGMESNLNS